VQGLSGIMVRHSLTVLGLHVPANASVVELHRLVVAYVVGGQLSEGQAYELVLDGLEANNKRAYLYTIDPAALRDWDAGAAPPAGSRVVRSRADVRPRASAGQGVVQYEWADERRIRVCIAEAQTFVRTDRRELVVRAEQVQRFVVVDADRTTGAVTLLMDPHAHQSLHGGAVAYKRHYEGRMASILGATPEPLPLQRALGRLEDAHLIDIVHSRAETEHGRMALTGGTQADIRKHPQYPQFRASRVNHDEDEFVWLPQPVPAREGATLPLRPLKTHITALAGEVRFALDAIACEVDYVLGQLRSHS
jgi:hypothetical protein